MDLHKDDTRAMLGELGFEVDRAYKFRMRDGERTASASINPKNGKIKDFGSGWSGDIIAFYKEINGCDDRTAFVEVGKIAEKLGINLNIKSEKSNYSNMEFAKFETEHKTDIKAKPISQKYIDGFAQERKENFDRFSALLAKTLPTFDSEKRKEIALKFEIGYSKKADRLIMPIRDENGNCTTLWKYNPSPIPIVADDGNIISLPKYTFTKDRPRSNTIFNYKDLSEIYIKEKDKPIFFAEGEKDCLNMIANGQRAISLGSASAKLPDKFLDMFKDTYAVICYDNDEAGKNGAKALAEQLKGTCKTVEIIDWNSIAKKAGLQNILFEKFDFTDFLSAVKNKKEKCKEL